MSKQPNSNGLLIAALFQSRGVLATLIVSQVIAILLAFSPMSLGDVWLRIAIFSCFLHLVFLSSLSLLYVCRALLTKLSHSKQLFILISTLLALTSVFSWLFLFVFSDVFAMESRANFIVSNLLIIFLVTALFSQFLLIHNQKEQQTKALAQAELDALQARIRPHFLFNSLNTAAELTHYDADAAEQAILALAALSQAAMRSGKAIKLVDEITLCQQYVALERWRYGERLALSWKLLGELPDIDIPCLTIQPIIENAVFYGVEPAEQGNISVEMHQSDKAYTFIITNPVAAEVNNSRTGNGMALDNIRQRLALFYQQKAQLTTTIRDDVFRVKLVIPKQRDA